MLILSSQVQGEDLENPVDSLYEFGIGSGGGFLPAYPGSEQNQFKVIALPYFNYRGTVLRADDKEGARARLLTNDIVDLDVSFAGSFPSSSAEIEARRGMPDLDWLGEIGPRAEILLKSFENGRLRLMLPLRVVLSTNLSSFSHRGTTFAPSFHFERYNFLVNGWKGVAKIQAAFIDEKLARYFYGVESIYVTASRPYYGARGGYLESDFMLSLVIPVAERVRFYAAGWASSLSKSTNSESPLLKKDWNYSLGFGLSWIFFKSDTPGHR